MKTVPLVVIDLRTIQHADHPAVLSFAVAKFIAVAVTKFGTRRGILDAVVDLVLWGIITFGERTDLRRSVLRGPPDSGSPMVIRLPSHGPIDPVEGEEIAAVVPQGPTFEVEIDRRKNWRSWFGLSSTIRRLRPAAWLVVMLRRYYRNSRLAAIHVEEFWSGHSFPLPCRRHPKERCSFVGPAPMSGHSNGRSVLVVSERRVAMVE